MTDGSDDKQIQLEEDLILAREVGRGIDPPCFPGFHMQSSGQRVNLWWRDRHTKSRSFCDAFLAPENRLTLVIASVSSSLDATGFALSLRGFLRGVCSTVVSLSNVIESLEKWGLSEPQWSGMCQLGIASVSSDGDVEYLCLGDVTAIHGSADNVREMAESSETMPLLFGMENPSISQEIHRVSLRPCDTFRFRGSSDDKPVALMIKRESSSLTDRNASEDQP